MKARRARLSLSLAAALVLSIVVGFLPVSADGPLAAATGGGYIVFLDEHTNFGFNAISQADGTTGQLQWQTRSGEVKLHAQLDCLRIVGNVAYMSGEITELTGLPQFIKYMLFAVEDNGQGAGALSPDRISRMRVSTAPLNCQLQSIAPEFDFVGGNADVRRP